MEQTARTYRRWSGEENNLLQGELGKNATLETTFITVATQTNRSVDAVRRHYYKSRIQEDGQEASSSNAPRKWTKEEDDILLRYVMAGVGNLNFCFIAVAEQIGRTPCAVSAHWYSVLSKREDVWAFFNASSKCILRNRKNGNVENKMGMPITQGFWKRLLSMVEKLFK